MNKLSVSKRACIAFVFCGATVIATPAQTTAGVPPAQTFTSLHNFDGTDGNYPLAALVQGTNGNFFGTTMRGGASGYGIVFTMTPSGTLKPLGSFGEGPKSGGEPYAGLDQGIDGKFYGTTFYGGAYGYGTVFSITAGDKPKTLHSFDYTDGDAPTASLIQGTDAKFYGTTSAGGAFGHGTVFSITARGTLTKLHDFNGTSGEYPVSALIQGVDGNFYGTTFYGGAINSCKPGCGTVFKITPSGELTTLHNFEGTDGEAPAAGLVRDANGIFFGTTYGGGVNGSGTIFSITEGGAFTTLYSFCLHVMNDRCSDGSGPQGALVQGTDGIFYGTTVVGGGSGACAHGCGTIFSITADGKLKTLHSFGFAGYPSDGADPFAGLVQGTNGKFYGTTAIGGATGYGTVFSLSVGLGPFVETNPVSGKVGTAITILGTSLTGATTVTFNGTAAIFTVKSSSEITTTVPTGATTGTVKVVTPGGTLSSNVPFRVTP